LVKPVALATSIDQGKMKVTMEGEARTSNKYHYTMPLKKNWCPACAKLHEDPNLWACSSYRNMPQTKKQGRAADGVPVPNYVSYASAVGSSSGR